MRKKVKTVETEVFRINQGIARLGICSRREADNLIKERKVMVNSQVVEDFSDTIKLGDVLTIAGKVYKFIPQPTRVFCFYKPKGCITSRSDDRGRLTVFDLIPRKHKNLIAIGRLDYNTEGLLLFTNDGEFARKMELPKSDIQRIYKVRAFGEVNQEKLEDIAMLARNGLEIDGVQYGKVIIRYDGVVKKLHSEGKTNHKFIIKIFEGKNNEIRKIMEHFGFDVNKLIRDSFGKYSIRNMKLGEFIESIVH